MSAVTLDDAKARLDELIEHLDPGAELVITLSGQPLAKLIKAGRTSWPCKAGSARDTVHWMAPDFNAPLDEFKEYME